MFLFLNLLWMADPLWESIESCGSPKKTKCLFVHSYGIVAYNFKWFLKPRFKPATVGREGKEGHLGLREQRDKGTKSLEGTALVLLELKVCPGGGWYGEWAWKCGLALHHGGPWVPGGHPGTKESHCIFLGEMMWLCLCLTTPTLEVWRQVRWLLQ